MTDLAPAAPQVDAPDAPAATVPKGFATWVGVLAAAGQFLAAFLIYLLADDAQKVGAIAPLVTAAATLREVLAGRMRQAEASIAASSPVAAAAERALLPPATQYLEGKLGQIVPPDLDDGIAHGLTDGDVSAVPAPGTPEVDESESIPDPEERA